MTNIMTSEVNRLWNDLGWFLWPVWPTAQTRRTISKAAMLTGRKSNEENFESKASPTLKPKSVLCR
jgi:hypothetical protein